VRIAEVPTVSSRLCRVGRHFADPRGDPRAFRIHGEPGVRFGARGGGWSVYVDDPDGNVVEIRSYES
jgi:hypothetical protein